VTAGKGEDPGEVTIERRRRPCYQQSVRSLALIPVILLGACPQPGGDDAPSDECHGACRAGEVCARDGECWPESEVRAVRTTWTMRGQPANETTCAQTPELYIEYDGASVSDDLAFSPVPCKLGLFNIDRLPRPFTRVELGVKRGPWARTTIPASNVVAFDLMF
jgi:hypothetical protein